MKLFGWMQNKLSNGKQEIRKPKAVPGSSYPIKQEPREEFNDWPHGLLAIGTFGNNPEINQPNKNNENNSEIQNLQEEEFPSSSMALQDFTPEEIGKFEKELTKLLRRKTASSTSSDTKEKEIASLPLDRFLNCPSSLEVDRRISNAICSTNQSDDHDHDYQYIKDEDIDRTISVILGRCKDIRADNTKKSIGKKSLTFLLKKMFVCRNTGFAPQPSLRDSLQESRMERFLRIMLNKKINPQNTSSGAQSMKKYIEGKKVSDEKRSNEDEKEKQEKIMINNNNNNNGCKWVKTDSEYIVLEI